ncbi:hypothetical protein [Pseudomonas sp. CGJS7]|uniref:hypothetical protein n=1 Tax=Pseudomonas sp. CGJS7 TaxID=3109348 RepID=UPI0030097DD4
MAESSGLRERLRLLALSLTQRVLEGSDDGESSPGRSRAGGNLSPFVREQLKSLDSRLRGNDEPERNRKPGEAGTQAKAPVYVAAQRRAPKRRDRSGGR